MSDARTIKCGACGNDFVTHRRADEPCPPCRTAPKAADFGNHRLDVIALALGSDRLWDALDSLDAEGFIVAPPGTALVPSEWLLALQRLVDPEFAELPTADARAVAASRSTRSGRALAFNAVRDHVRTLPAVTPVTLTTGAKS